MLNTRIFFLSLTILSGFFVSGQGSYIVDSIAIGNSYRTYLLYVPASYSAGSNVPLVINLHETGSDANQQMLYGNFNKIADTANFIVVMPEATGQTSFWNAGLGSTPNEGAFISAMIDTIKKDYSIDLNRVYSAGYGNGGVMSLYLMCSLNSRIAAYASVAGSMYGNWFYNCPASRALPLIMINGTSDATVPYAGSSLYVPVDTVIKKWRVHNKCQANSSVNVPDTNTADGCHVILTRYSNGTDGSAVELFRVENGSHSWPNGPPYVANTNYDMDASSEIWRFFRQFSLSQFPTKVGVEVHGLQKMILFPNPVADVLHVDGFNEGRFIVYSADGKMLLEDRIEKEVKVDALPAGIYLMVLENTDGRHYYRFIRE